jgi:Skp family chaperone for outer membrane proteins
MKALTTLTLLCLAGSAFAQVKVATVDMAKLFDGYNRAKAVEAAIEADLDKIASEVQRRQNEGRQMMEAMEDLRQKQMNTALAQEARDAAKKQARELEDKLEARRVEFEKFQADSRKSMAEKQRLQREKIYDEIQNAATAVARKQGANMVVNISEKTNAGLPVVVYSEPTWDITPSVLATLNAGSSAPAPKPAAPAKAPAAKPAAAK